jgi:hypothetical protein
MDENLLKSCFLELANEKIPENGQPWLVFSEKVKKSHSKRSTMPNTTHGTGVRFTKKYAYLVGLAVILISVIFFITPAGRVAAKNIAEFFIRLENSWKIVPPEYDQTTVWQETIEPSSVPITTEFFIQQRQRTLPEGDSLDYLTFDQAASLVSYPLIEPQRLPDGYQFGYAINLAETENTLLVYPFQPVATGEMIMLTLSPTLLQDEIGPEVEVKKVEINGFEGEMVQGGWLALAGQEREYWEPNVPVTTLRWFDGALYLKIQFHLNEPSSPAFLSLSQMLAVAESISNSVDNVRPVATEPLEQVPSEQTYSDLEVEIGYNLLQPGVLPQGFSLDTIDQVPGSLQVTAYYSLESTDQTGPRLTISQIPLTSIPEIKQQDYPDTVEIVDVLGNQGRIIKGVEDGTGSSPSWFLYWETQDTALSIWFSPGSGADEETIKTILVRMAESMR